MKIITASDVEGRLTWHNVIDAIQSGHCLPKAQVDDQFLAQNGKTFLSRAAWIEGLGFGVKSVSIMSGNPALGLPTVQGAMLVFEDRAGQLKAIIDSALITNWKTAADSVLGAKLLARPDSRSLLIVGAGSVAESLVHAYRAAFPQLERIAVWNRTSARAEQLVEQLSADGIEIEIAYDLPSACAAADIVSSATMAREPVLLGDWVKPGTHVDLIGAFKLDMREADDALMQKARLFVDSYDTTLHHIGEMAIPLASGAICEEDVLADLYELVQGINQRHSREEITLFKNGGGAHLDLMTAHCILKCCGDGPISAL